MKPPSAQFIFRCRRIKVSTKGVNRTIEGGVLLINISFNCREVRSQSREEELHQFLILEDQRRHSVITTSQFCYEDVVGQLA